MNFDTIARKIESGEEISRADGEFLLKEGNEGEIADLACDINRKIHGNRITYVKNRNINFTNVCNIRCHFCGFWRMEDQDESFTLTLDQILAKIATTPGITEVCIQGAIHPRLGMDYYLEMLRQIRAHFPFLHIHGISPQEIHSLTEKTGLALPEVIGRLMKAGLGSMAGTAAEILVDEVRRKISPAKISSARWTEIVQTAHRMGLPSTATILIGHIERDGDIIAHLDRIRTIQRRTQGFTEFIPLPFVPFRTRLGSETGQKEMVPWRRLRRIYAVCRLFLFPAIPNLQTSWVKLGLRRALETLELGVNDFGGTLFEENITRSAGGGNGESLSEAQIREVLIRAGKIPCQRTTLYGEVNGHV
jgi:7,8-didemethyl-8-hydroxy-5-deazariboflavin synthase CofH subunit